MDNIQAKELFSLVQKHFPDIATGAFGFVFTGKDPIVFNDGDQKISNFLKALLLLFNAGEPIVVPPDEIFYTMYGSTKEQQHVFFVASPSKHTHLKLFVQFMFLYCMDKDQGSSGVRECYDEDFFLLHFDQVAKQYGIKKEESSRILLFAQKILKPEMFTQ